VAKTTGTTGGFRPKINFKAGIFPCFKYDDGRHLINARSLHMHRRRSILYKALAIQICGHRLITLFIIEA
jgi:hypothetical protein